MLSPKDIGWLAGILEGEGCFSIRDTGGTNPGLSIQLQMTDEDVILRAFHLTNLGTIYGPTQYSNRRKPMYHWYVANKKEVVQILMTIYPLMHSRRQAKIKELLAVWKSIPHDSCRKGHPRNGLNKCKVCINQNQRRRRSVEQNDKFIYPQ